MNTGKRIISTFIVALMLLTAAPLAAGFIGLEFAPKAQAYSIGDHIQFGTYPQTRVNETPELQAAADEAKWRSYDYYTGTGTMDDGNMTPSDYMCFADFFYDGTKYRAVTIKSYRPMYTGYISVESNSSQIDNGYLQNSRYYFKYEPLTWRILDPSSGFVVCEEIIDAQSYQNTIFKDKNKDSRQGIDSTIYANDYKSSSIRDWLNFDFYETAFTAHQKENIRTTQLNNKAYPTDSQYNSASTNDKIFLLSYYEVVKKAYGFEDSSSVYDVARRAKGTDYAKCQGLEVDDSDSYNGNSLWLLRSPGHGSASTSYVLTSGCVQDHLTVSYAFAGIRPACILRILTEDRSQTDSLFSGGISEHSTTEMAIENVNLASNTEMGTYDEVFYCTVCGKELSREKKTLGQLEQLQSNCAVGDHIQFGNYPQTRVNETDALSIAANSATWKSYNYYSAPGDSWGGIHSGSMESGSWMQFADFYCDGSKYRVVRFTKYRPFATEFPANSSYTNQIHNGYSLNKNYYFRYEPLIWRVLDPSVGLVMCESIVDSQAYQNTVYYRLTKYYLSDWADIYANDYEHSSIRKWLNDDFYETAFNSFQKANIKKTWINNKASSEAYSQYSSPDTYDKVFLLSYEDVLNNTYGFSSTYSEYDETRAAQGTDYAKCQGLQVQRDKNQSFYNNSPWNLRSPGYTAGNAAVAYSGYVNNGHHGYDVNYTNQGVRPACMLSLIVSNIVQSDCLYSGGVHVHSFRKEVIENELVATCLNTGQYEKVEYCSMCGVELSRETIVTSLTDHKYDDIRKENIYEASCSSEGSYDSVVYCGVCGVELNREKVIIPAFDHTDTDNDGKCDTCNQKMTGGKHCKYCGKIHGGAFGWLVKFFHSILAIFKR